MDEAPEAELDRLDRAVVEKTGIRIAERAAANTGGADATPVE